MAKQKLNFINRSSDKNNSSVVIFEENASGSNKQPASGQPQAESRTTSGHELNLEIAPNPAKEVEVRNDLTEGSVDTRIFKDDKLL